MPGNPSLRRALRALAAREESGKGRFVFLRLVAKKNYKDAIQIFTDLIKRYPEKSFQENIALNLALCYEEELDFKGAIDVLNTLKNRYKPAEYIELRIKRVETRSKNAPGAKGFRK